MCLALKRKKEKKEEKKGEWCKPIAQTCEWGEVHKIRKSRGCCDKNLEFYCRIKKRLEHSFPDAFRMNILFD